MRRIYRIRTFSFVAALLVAFWAPSLSSWWSSSFLGENTGNGPASKWDSADAADYNEKARLERSRRGGIMRSSRWPDPIRSSQDIVKEKRDRDTPFLSSHSTINGHKGAVQKTAVSSLSRSTSPSLSSLKRGKQLNSYSKSPSKLLDIMTLAQDEVPPNQMSISFTKMDQPEDDSAPQQSERCEREPCICCSRMNQALAKSYGEQHTRSFGQQHTTQNCQQHLENLYCAANCVQSLKMFFSQKGDSLKVQLCTQDCFTLYESCKSTLSNPVSTSSSKSNNTCSTLSLPEIHYDSIVHNVKVTLEPTKAEPSHSRCLSLTSSVQRIAESSDVHVRNASTERLVQSKFEVRQQPVYAHISRTDEHSSDNNHKTYAKEIVIPAQQAASLQKQQRLEHMIQNKISNLQQHPNLQQATTPQQAAAPATQPGQAAPAQAAPAQAGQAAPAQAGQAAPVQAAPAQAAPAQAGQAAPAQAGQAAPAQAGQAAPAQAGQAAPAQAGQAAPAQAGQAAPAQAGQVATAQPGQPVSPGVVTQPVGTPGLPPAQQPGVINAQTQPVQVPLAGSQVNPAQAVVLQPVGTPVQGATPQLPPAAPQQVVPGLPAQQPNMVPGAPALDQQPGVVPAQMQPVQVPSVGSQVNPAQAVVAQPVGIPGQLATSPLLSAVPQQIVPGVPVPQVPQATVLSSAGNVSTAKEDTGFCFTNCTCWPMWGGSIMAFVAYFGATFIAIFMTANLFSRGLWSQTFYKGGGYWLIASGSLGLITGGLIGGLVPWCVAGGLTMAGSMMSLMCSIVLVGRRGAWLGALGGLGSGGIIGVMTKTGILGIALGLSIGFLLGLIVGFAPFARNLKMNDRYIRRGLSSRSSSPLGKSKDLRLSSSSVSSYGRMQTQERGYGSPTESLGSRPRTFSDRDLDPVASDAEGQKRRVMSGRFRTLGGTKPFTDTENLARYYYGSHSSHSLKEKALTPSQSIVSRGTSSPTSQRSSSP